MVYDESDQLRSDQEEKRREKFSRERGPDYSNMDRGGGRRFGGPERRDYNNGLGRKRPIRDDDLGAPSKRSRFDGATDSYEPHFVRKDGGDISVQQGGTQILQLLTFKKFLATQDESMTDEQAIEKYKEYKIEFMKQECERYFQAHKEEEWFRLKYHPEDGKQRTEENRQNLQNRLEIFNEFLSTGRFDGLALSYENAERIIRIFDEVVIKLEGGTDADIQAANEEEIEDESVLDLLSQEQLKKKETEKKSCNSVSKGSLNAAENDTKTARNTEEDMEATNADEEAPQNSNQDAEMKPSVKRNQPHKTRSIYFRTVPADATLDSLENLCKQHPGFLRLALTDPSPDSKGKLMRSAWATYRWDVNIKDIFWALRNANLNGTELGTSINREFKCRVRTIGATRGLTGHRPIVQNDIRNAAKLVVLLDSKVGFYKEEAEEGEEQTLGGDNADLADLEATVLRSRNPLLAGTIKKFMVEECSAEEEAILEKAAEIDGSEVTQHYELDQLMVEYLDRLLWYLRIVHSVDYYASSEYHSEDDMPYRLGIVHVRGRPPSSSTKNWPCTDRGIPLLSRNAVNQHIALFNARNENGLIKKLMVAESELVKLGKKDAEKAVEDFMNTNAQQLGPEKWLCPLSGKKFKGAEFVQKHLQTKFAKEIETARYEALYFNNFLADPGRPHNPIFAKSTNPFSQMDERRERDPQRSQSPPPLRPRRSSGEENVGGRQVVETNDRPAYQRGGGGGWGGSGGGGNRYGGGGGRPFGGGGGGFGAPPRRPFHEPFNEMNMGGGRKDPRAPPSYRDLDAPSDEPIF